MAFQRWITLLIRRIKPNTNTNTENRNSHTNPIKKWVYTVYKKPQAKSKSTRASNDSQSVTPEAKRAATPDKIAEQHRNVVGLGELPSTKEHRSPVTPPPGAPRRDCPFTPDTMHDPRSPRKSINFPFHARAPNEASLHLVATRSSDYYILDNNPMFSPATLPKPVLEDEGIARPDSPTLELTGECPVAEWHRPMSSHRRSRIDLPTLTGRHVRSNSENWVLYELDADHDVASGSHPGRVNILIVDIFSDPVISLSVVEKVTEGREDYKD
ncbi:hypothetical protein L211DRAFT_845782 [Terfezia boudieri ATCC MYA-4762]|uniref:Uncharacterized protein n=1 Tax=Terfezia boudieri ATCC MYA-4762 TaxID=1051890 RepID=A0A3N4LY00_9PEZI|nr:hypothetical protein L211DRAFT_845782 [Terfezia boudieri ATCC MYA-4762]